MNRALVSGRHVRAEEEEDDSEMFGDKMKKLAAELRAQPTDAANLDDALAINFEELKCDH